MLNLLRNPSDHYPIGEPDAQFSTGEFIGLELELENYHRGLSNHQYELINEHWALTSDGSLRNGGIEFVFRQPMCNSDITKAITQFSLLKNSFKGSNKLVASLRTSCHVHLNVCDLDVHTLSNLLLISVMYEPLLYRLVGRARVFNNNCVPIHDNPIVANIIYKLRQLPLYQQGNSAVYEMLQEDIRYHSDVLGKYCGINISSIFKESRGSLEFRMCEGTTNTHLIRNWVKTIIHLKDLARNVEFMTDLFVLCEGGDVEGLTSEHLLHTLVKPNSFLYKRALSFTDHETLVADITTGLDSIKQTITLIETGDNSLDAVNAYLKTA